FRRWKNRVKGRDWYDFEWYVRQGISLNVSHLEERARQSGDWQGGPLTVDALHALLRERIASLDVSLAKRDVQPFLRNPQELDIWSAEYFQGLVNRIVVL
ncbi:MAG: nucleotidyl transferase AbiEii/AbiGii toxin family protein, partial [Alcanivoracaceae bacterium]|nr:nucleotidyl transferase AbiEii/AbiGii toxin family protein [Alcanivoracaceae bacterium]